METSESQAHVDDLKHAITPSNDEPTSHEVDLLSIDDRTNHEVDTPLAEETKNHYDNIPSTDETSNHEGIISPMDETSKHEFVTPSIDETSNHEETSQHELVMPSIEETSNHEVVSKENNCEPVDEVDIPLTDETRNHEDNKPLTDELSNNEVVMSSIDETSNRDVFMGETSKHDVVMPSTDETSNHEVVNKENISESSSSSDEEESEKQLVIADEQNDEKETNATTDVRHFDTIQQKTNKEENPINENTIKNEYSIPQEPVELENNFKTEESEYKLIKSPIPKLNGNHSLSLNNEDTCSSTTSSASSHNLVIDHPLAEEQPPVNTKENNLSEDIKANEVRSLKRKLSSCGNDSPQYKHIHLDSPIASRDKDDYKPETPFSQYQEGRNSNANEIPPTPSFLEKSTGATNCFQEQPLALIKSSHSPDKAANFVEENIHPTFFQQLQSNYLEANNVTLKEKPPPTLDAYTGCQSSSITLDCFKEIPTPAKFMSPQSYGPYPVYTSNNLPSSSCLTEISSLVAQQGQTSNPRFAATTSEKKSNQPIGLYDHYTTISGKKLPTPKLSYECFKCKNAVFESFNQLRDHHRTCLFSDNHQKIPLTPTTASESQTVVARNKVVAVSNPPGPPELPSPALPKPKKHFYLCSSCGTYHENWNLFLHIREIHNRHVCLYCIRMFPTAEKLSLHLEIKHDLEQNHFNSEDKIRSVSKGDGNSRFLMCCTCQHVFSEHENFSDHVCTEYLQPCAMCGQKGRHMSNCKANPEKRPKAKRKPMQTTKAIAAPPTAVIATKANNKLPKVSKKMAAWSAPVQVCDSKFNNNTNTQVVMPTLPLVPHSIAPPVEFSKQNGYSEMPNLFGGGGYSQAKPASFEDHSDDSTNMVIDETCITNNYFNQMPSVNPFKALDERERLQGVVQKTAEIRSTLPPDRVPEAIPEPKPLIVPKIKLCVPREFQKAVDLEVSSIDSNEEENEDEQETGRENVDREKNIYLSLKNNRMEDNLGNDSSSTEDRDVVQDDGGELDSKLDRILKAIEKTQSEIRKTKEKMMRTSPGVVDHREKNTPSTDVLVLKQDEGQSVQNEDKESPMQAIQVEVPAVEPVLSSIEEPAVSTFEPVLDKADTNVSPIMNNEKISWTTPERGMYSPTPAPTPNSVWASPFYQQEDGPTVSQAVSNRDNIENMDVDYDHEKEQTPETENMETSGDLDEDFVQNQEESTMDIEEKSKQTPPNSSPLEVMNFSPLPETENKNDDTASTEEIDVENEEIEVVNENIPPADGIEVANEDILVTDLLLDRPIEKFETIEFVRLCVKAVYSLCLYCNHARRIAVCGHSLVLHLLAHHRFAATVDSITAEELLPSTIVSKLKSFLPDLEEHYFNLESYSSLPPKEDETVAICNERVFECFQCRFSTKMHKDLYLHNRKMHLKTAILCFMCRSNFFSFSEILCHICPGTPNKVTVFDIKFRCCLCDVDGIPSPFRLMVHLRKKHFACDICLEDCHIQAKLSSHVWKHKLHHLCYRCGIAYRNKMDITKHLFWKHGTESIICKRCLQKRWRHVYHFCVPPVSFTCDECSLSFSKATYLKVHQRQHTGDFRYACTEDDCEEKFVSRKLLLKHSATHAPPPEVKAEDEKTENEEENKKQQEAEVKEEETALQEEKPLPVQPSDVKEEEKKSDEKKVEEIPEVGSKRKKKKSRNKESLEDLNLIAPNLSESDSSGESDVERPKTDDKDSLVPNVMLSPPSEEEKDEDKVEEVDKDAGQIVDIWENFKSFQASQQSKKDEDDDDVKSFSESDYPTPILHVACSDHDYCAMYKIRNRVVTEEFRSAELPLDSEPLDVTSDTERRANELMKRKQSISPNKNKRKSTGSHSSSSGSSSDSSSRSSCSCKTNCSCSSSSSGSGSSSSSDDSDSSTSEGRRRIAKKRQDRAERNRLKSENSQKISISENVDIGGVDDKKPVIPEVKENLEPIFIETDLETAESETDEEFYDEHPQKLASEMLAQKRLQLQEQMRLSPSHNFDIMENSRPSTPSLPEEMMKEKKVKMKKKKRDRKSTCKSQAVPPIKLNLTINKVEIVSNEQVMHHQTAMHVPEVDLFPPYDLIASPGVAEPPVAQQPIAMPMTQNHTVKPVPFFHNRMSEGSSCSDADSSLKRSQRARRPNKFYGYTSDDENLPGTPLMIGTKTFKPQPPPQLTWRKEDLPAPSKSILLNKQPRTPKTPAIQKGPIKKRLLQKTGSSKKKQQQLPPIPTLKIRPPKPNKPAVDLPPPPPPPVATNQSFSTSRDDSDESDSSDDDLELPATNSALSGSVIPTWNPAPVPVPVELPPRPPSPQATVFNQKIPPALLPNPDFATIQYFKRNNIRYPIRPPAGARQARDGESVYCYCRCPYDEVSEMIACDGENCLIEWFHFECVGIMVAPQGKWFCAECRPKYSNQLYPQLA